ncbi:MAG: carboxylating nicotinate-nucleotide diphosphorylase [Actinomycetota bacterium]
MLEAQVEALVRAFIDEDVGRGDRTTDAVVPADARGRARIEAREPCIVAGLGVARACFETVASAPVEWRAHASEGDAVEPMTAVVHIDGPLRAILTAERTALNLLARACGIATLTRRFVDAVAGTPVRILDTRKTTPGLRAIEKHAVRAGGGSNHRFGLDDGILIKDNHIAAAGGITAAVDSARACTPPGMSVEVEVSDLDGLGEALVAGAAFVLLDNMTPSMVADAVARAGGKAVLEASGGIDLDNVRAYAETGVELISVGALTHSARSIDLSLEVEARW